MTDLNLFIPMTKVDMQTRQVWGRATQEVVDGHKEIFDYDSSVPFFQRWSDNVQKRSKGKSMGNLRAMHQPIAAGKLIAINFNDAEKAIDIGTHVTDDKEWQKVLDGVYTGFSVGGKYAKRWMDMQIAGATRFTADPNEISLVDAPAVPTATFELIKTDGTREMVKFHNITGGEEPPIKQEETEGAIPPAEAQLREVESDAVIEEVDPNNPEAGAAMASENALEPAAVKDTPPEWLGKFQEQADKLSASINQLIDLRKQEAEREEKVIAELKLRGERVGIARREGSPWAPPQGYPSAWQSYADPANYAFPMEKALAAEQIASYNLDKGREHYAPREWMVLGRRIARLASDVFGMTYKFSPTDAKVERNEMEKQQMNTNVQKTDVTGLFRNLQEQLSDATKLIGTDPAAAMNLLTQAQAAIDVTSNVSTIAPVAKSDIPASSEPGEEKCAKCSESLTKDASFCAKCGAKVEKVAAPEDPILKAIADQTKALEALNANIAKMSQAPTAPGVLPIGDLNSIVEANAQDADPVAKALTDGNLQKAFAEVGNDANKLYEHVNNIAVKQIYDQGLNVSRFGVFNLPVSEG